MKKWKINKDRNFKGAIHSFFNGSRNGRNKFTDFFEIPAKKRQKWDKLEKKHEAILKSAHWFCGRAVIGVNKLPTVPSANRRADHASAAEKLVRSHFVYAISQRKLAISSDFSGFCGIRNNKNYIKKIIIAKKSKKTKLISEKFIKKSKKLIIMDRDDPKFYHFQSFYW